VGSWIVGGVRRAWAELVDADAAVAAELVGVLFVPLCDSTVNG
jgi:hypothetical protein